MKKYLIIVVVLGMFCLNFQNAFAIINTLKVDEEEIYSNDSLQKMRASVESLKTIANKYLNIDQNRFETYKKQEKKISIPWINQIDDFIDWTIRLNYNGKSFEQKVPIDITDFKEKFLKHPEYGEIIYFNIDSDPQDDVEVIIGFYWSIIQYPNHETAKSLETRFRVRQLETGNYIEDSDGELEVWSELHVNYGLVKNKSSDTSKNSQLLKTSNNRLITRIIGLLNNVQEKFNSYSQPNYIKKLLSKIQQILYQEDNNEEIESLAADGDYFSIGAGYRSPEGVEIPRYTEKYFAFARDNIFSPTIFQHEIDPGPSIGKSPIELIYGFRSFTEGANINNPTYDIAFSVEFDPSVYLLTKYIPIGGYVYYYFDQNSQRTSDTKITFSSNVLKGSGEGIELSLLFDEIDNTLGRTGNWMSFDIDIIGTKNLLGFHYRASNKFSIALSVESPVFEEKVKINGIPTSVDFSWDVGVDLVVLPNIVDVGFGGSLELDMSSTIDDIIVYYPKLDPEEPDSTFIHASDIPANQKLSADASLMVNGGNLLTVSPEGYIDFTMSSPPGEINMYYPKAESIDPETVFISIPKGLPSSTRVGAEATVHVDLNNLLNPSNYIYGKIYHDCSKNFDELDVFIPGESYPLIKVTDVPAYTEARSQINWGILQGYAYAWRGSNGPPDPIEINVEYGGLTLNNVMEIRDGHISTGFKIAEDGYFKFDTSNKMFGNSLQVSSSDTGDSVSLSVDEISADNLHAHWSIDTSGDRIEFKGLGFGGIIDTLTDLHLGLNYKGKTGGLDLDWTVGEEGSFSINLEQNDDLTLDFNDFLQNSTQFDVGGEIVLSRNFNFDMSWRFKRGESASDPGYFRINQNNNDENLKVFDLYFVYQNQYGVDINFENLKFYLDLEWYINGIHPYIWLDYEFSFDDFNGRLLWTGPEGTNWYEVIL